MGLIIKSRGLKGLPLLFFEGGVPVIEIVSELPILFGGFLNLKIVSYYTPSPIPIA